MRNKRITRPASHLHTAGPHTEPILTTQARNTHDLLGAIMPLRGIPLKAPPPRPQSHPISHQSHFLSPHTQNLSYLSYAWPFSVLPYHHYPAPPPCPLPHGFLVLYAYPLPHALTRTPSRPWPESTWWPPTSRPS